MLIIELNMLNNFGGGVNFFMKFKENLRNIEKRMLFINN